MKHLTVFMIANAGMWLSLASCSSPEPTSPKETVEKRIEITLQGNIKKLSRFIKISAQTEDETDRFSYIVGKDTMQVKHVFMSDSTFIKGPRYIFESKTTYSTINFHIFVRYLHVMYNPTDSDNIGVKIQAFKNNKLVKEDSCTLQALDYACLQKHYKPSMNTYIHRFYF